LFATKAQAQERREEKGKTHDQEIEVQEENGT